MEKSHLNRLRLKYPEALEGKETAVLLIPDDYEFMQQELIEELQEKVRNYLPV
ncbi:MAG: hypothetical protein SFY81_15295 [Verrucomicrobiota bacterium]|nr:hypothetical protein [Verrucomicrobiota bacterium]